MDQEAASSVTVDRDVPYRETPERTLHLDTYSPDEATGSDANESGLVRSRPAVVYVHGGGWQMGDKGELARAALDLADAGFVCVDVNYRLSGEATFPAQIRDVKAAIAWVRDHADGLGVDPDRIATMGHSSGAHLAALASVTGDDAFGERQDVSTAVQAVVGISGIYDLTTADEDPDIYRQFLGGTSDESPDRYRRASPLPAATADAPPTFLVHGTDDEAVPATQSERYRDQLADLGVETDLLVADGGDHMVPFRNEWYDEIVDRSDAFLRSNL